MLNQVNYLNPNSWLYSTKKSKAARNQYFQSNKNTHLSVYVQGLEKSTVRTKENMIRKIMEIDVKDHVQEIKKNAGVLDQLISAVDKMHRKQTVNADLLNQFKTFIKTLVLAIAESHDYGIHLKKTLDSCCQGDWSKSFFKPLIDVVNILKTSIVRINEIGQNHLPRTLYVSGVSSVKKGIYGEEENHGTSIKYTVPRNDLYQFAPKSKWWLAINQTIVNYRDQEDRFNVVYNN